jgi:ABC-type transport system substrate-binding protein
VIRRPAVAASDALPVGTGPFRLTAWEAGQRVALQANDDYWGGRPFVDNIEVQMGRSSREQLLDLELDKADLVELDPVEARRAQQEGKKLWTSAPVELLALRFDLNKPAVQDRRLRQAVADSIDRAAIQKVLLQNYGEAAASLFPKGVSGYAFLFPTAMELDRARQLTAEIGTPPTLKLGYDAADALARLTAERLAVNARDAGITLQVAPLPAGWRRMPDAGTDLRVERARIDAPTLGQAFRQAAFGLGFAASGALENPEQIYAAEQKFLDGLAAVPLVYAPELVGVGPRLKDWSALPWGAWQLDEVWVEAEKP